MIYRPVISSDVIFMTHRGWASEKHRPSSREYKTSVNSRVKVCAAYTRYLTGTCVKLLC